MKTINIIYDTTHQNKEECLQHLYVVKRRVMESKENGQLKQSEYEQLNGKISQYIQQVSAQ